MKKFILAAIALAVGAIGFGTLGAPSTQAVPTAVVSISGPVWSGLTTVPAASAAAADADDTEENKAVLAGVAGAIGDEDGVLEASDLADIDLDGNQLNEHADQSEESMLVFVFVDDDDPVTLDPKTLDSPQNGLDPDDGNVLCGTGGDFTDEDCDGDGIAGDGVVVFQLTACGKIITCSGTNLGNVDSGDTVKIEVEQESVLLSDTINIVGDPDDFENILEAEEVLQTQSAADCGINAGDWADPDAGDALDIIALLAIVVDNDGTQLTGVPVNWDTSDSDLASIEDDSGITIETDFGNGAVALLCGGDTTGEVTVTADFDSRPGDTSIDPAVQAEDFSVTKTVVGEPANVSLSASPAAIDCNGVNSATVTATVTDADGNNVVDGTPVRFDVVALGTASPIRATTTDGQASSTVTPLSGNVAGVTVVVSAGDAEASVRVDCILATPTAPAASPTPTGPITPPVTGNGGYLSQNAAGGFSWIALAGLALGALALTLGGAAVRKVSR